jgi:hypothetical protein
MGKTDAFLGARTCLEGKSCIEGLLPSPAVLVHCSRHCRYVITTCVCMCMYVCMCTICTVSGCDLFPFPTWTKSPQIPRPGCEPVLTLSSPLAGGEKPRCEPGGLESNQNPQLNAMAAVVQQ